MDGTVPGGLLGTSDPAAQKRVLAEGFHRLIHTLAANEIPHTLLHFPRFALDGDYAWTKLRFLAPGVGRVAFAEAFRRVARPELVHHFGAARAEDSGRAAERFLRAERRKRRRRRTKRFAAALVIFAAAIMAVRMYSARARSAAPAAPASAASSRQ
jgi:hypothetical protein